MTEYFLPHHVHFCCRGDAMVFLDLRRDDYILVNGDCASILKALSSRERKDGLKSESVVVLKELAQDGLLTTDQNAGRVIAPTKIVLALERLIDSEGMPETHLSTRDIWRFLAACTKAAVQLRWQPLENTVRDVKLRKAGRVMEPADIKRARELTAVFQSLRSFFPVNYLCLYDCLALVEFLARYGLFPTWVFGVKLEPWTAHCWVQETQFIFNEDVEEAAGYTPVLII